MGARRTPAPATASTAAPGGEVVCGLNGTYALGEVIGEGTFAVVYRARSTTTGGAVAVKRLKQHESVFESTRARDELCALRRLAGDGRRPQNPNVVEVLDVAKDGEQLDLVLQLFEHCDFATALAERQFTAPHVNSYMRGLLRGLVHIHSLSFVHRDIKPTNVLYNFAERRALIVDFGLVQRFRGQRPRPGAPPTHSQQQPGRAAEPEGGATAGRRPPLQRRRLEPLRAPHSTSEHPRSMVAPREGTKGFRAPEVLLRCPRQGPAIDVWAAGVVMLTLVTRRYPLLAAPETKTDEGALAEVLTLLGTNEFSRALNDGIISERLCTFLAKQPARAGAAAPLPLSPSPRHLEAVLSSAIADAGLPSAARYVVLHALRLSPVARYSAPQLLSLAYFDDGVARRGQKRPQHDPPDDGLGSSASTDSAELA